MVLFDVLYVGVAVVALWFGADQFVTGASRVARRLGVPGLVIGLTVVAFGTSAPEFAVTIDAALAGQSDISVANVVGSNVLNLGFILGGVALVRAMATSRTLVRRDGLLLVASTALLLVVALDGHLSAVEGDCCSRRYWRIWSRSHARRATARRPPPTSSTRPTSVGCWSASRSWSAGATCWSSRPSTSPGSPASPSG
ncbi:sodium:calcium antiporter [Halomicroarcula sp. GCM10025894]|uniref:sodium:calcium antiporter n=1 Tax=Halomicroarcula sp. GCM10025894 TaxID=3252673 RepID=UPI0036069082